MFHSSKKLARDTFQAALTEMRELITGGSLLIKTVQKGEREMMTAHRRKKEHKQSEKINEQTHSMKKLQTAETEKFSSETCLSHDNIPSKTYPSFHPIQQINNYRTNRKTSKKQ